MPHEVVTDAVQAPVPSHVDVVTSVLFVQEPGVHTFELSGKTHAVALLPSQVAAHVPLPAQGVRPPWGCSFDRVVHVPSADGRSHAWHWPGHAESQQCPSTQKPLAQSNGALHTAPFAALGRQIPAEQ